MKKTLVKDLMTTDVVTLDKQQAIPLAQELMRLLRIRHVPVVEEGTGKLEGLVTHRGLLGAQVELLAQLSGAQETEQELSIPVSKAMTTEVFTTTPETAVVDALRKMLRNKRGSLPVLEDGKVVGIVTSRDLLRFQLELLERAEEGDADQAAAADGVTELDATEEAEEVEPAADTSDAAAELRSLMAAHVREHRHQRWISSLILLLLAALIAFLLVRELNRAPPGEPATESATSAETGSQVDPAPSEPTLKARKPARHSETPVPPTAVRPTDEAAARLSSPTPTARPESSATPQATPADASSTAQEQSIDENFLQRIDQSVFSMPYISTLGESADVPSSAEAGARARGPLSPADRRGPQGSPWVPEPMAADRVGRTQR